MTDDSPQTRAYSNVLPVEGTAYLLRNEMRTVRFALDYAKAELLLSDWGIGSTEGCSAARTPSPEQADAPNKPGRL